MIQQRVPTGVDLTGKRCTVEQAYNRNKTLSGSIEGEPSIRNRYDITIQQIREAPRETLVAAAVAVDALEGN